MLKLRILIAILISITVAFYGGIRFSDFLVSPTNIDRNLKATLGFDFPDDAVIMELKYSDPYGAGALYQFAFVKNKGEQFCADNELKPGNPRNDPEDFILDLPASILHGLGGNINKIICYGTKDIYYRDGEETKKIEVGVRYLAVAQVDRALLYAYGVPLYRSVVEKSKPPNPDKPLTYEAINNDRKIHYGTPLSPEQMELEVQRENAKECLKNAFTQLADNESEQVLQCLNKDSASWHSNH